jgi:demethylmenaquinone methyltransferase/2-methoxy-6-polyprenyl-1,4-benzoquinol methylase
MPTDWFAVYAPIYNTFARLAGVAPVAPLLELVELQAHESVLDVGGGTGRVARVAVESCREVTVLDPCRAMLQRIPPRSNLHAVPGRAQAMPFQDNEFDVLLCVDALHHIKDASAAVAEMHRVLRPGGRVLVQEFDVRSWRGKAVQTFEHLLVDNSRFMDPTALEALFWAAGIQGTTHRRSWLEYVFLGCVVTSCG